MRAFARAGASVYECALGHEHVDATFAILCEQAPKLDVRAEFAFDAQSHSIVESYSCNRCGTKQRSEFRGLATLENHQAKGTPFEREPGHQVGRMLQFGETVTETAKWRLEAHEFHQKHIACNVDAKQSAS